jgi:hypothetical protein
MFVKGYCVYEVPQVYLYTIDYSKKDNNTEQEATQYYGLEPTSTTIDNFASDSTPSVEPTGQPTGQTPDEIPPPKTTSVYTRIPQKPDIITTQVKRTIQTPDERPPYVPEKKDKYMLGKIIVFLFIIFMIMYVNKK